MKATGISADFWRMQSVQVFFSAENVILFFHSKKMIFTESDSALSDFAGEICESNQRTKEGEQDCWGKSYLRWSFFLSIFLSELLQHLFPSKKMKHNVAVTVKIYNEI